MDPTPQTVRRWDVIADSLIDMSASTICEQSDDGEFVRYADHVSAIAELQAEIERLNALLARQKISYEREIEIEREACADLCESMQYKERNTPINCAEAIRSRGAKA